MTCSIIPVDLAGLAVFVAHRKVILGQREVGAPHRITLLSARQGANSLSDANKLLGTAKLFFGDSSLDGYPQTDYSSNLYSEGSFDTGPQDASFRGTRKKEGNASSYGEKRTSCRVSWLLETLLKNQPWASR